VDSGLRIEKQTPGGVVFSSQIRNPQSSIHNQTVHSSKNTGREFKILLRAVRKGACAKKLIFRNLLKLWVLQLH